MNMSCHESYELKAVHCTFGKVLGVGDHKHLRDTALQTHATICPVSSGENVWAHGYQEFSRGFGF